MTKGSTDNREEVVAVAIDKDKGSQYALKWTVDHILTRGQALTLVHVNQRTSSFPKTSKKISTFCSCLCLCLFCMNDYAGRILLQNVLNAFIYIISEKCI
jgi:hypothetical protein